MSYSTLGSFHAKKKENQYYCYTILNDINIERLLKILIRVNIERMIILVSIKMNSRSRDQIHYSDHRHLHHQFSLMCETLD